MINKWFYLYNKNRKKVILIKKMNNIRLQLIKAVRDNNNEKRDKLLKTYNLLLVEFENE